jgi:hypothetical protein
LCYFVNTVPVIHGLSANTGYTNGGQNLTINGFGLENEIVKVKVAGKDCKVTHKQNDMIHCTTAKAAQASTTGVLAGTNGVRKMFINGTKWHSDLNSIHTLTGKNVLGT